MKKLVVLFLVSVISFSLVACGGDKKQAEINNELQMDKSSVDESVQENLDDEYSDNVNSDDVSEQQTQEDNKEIPAEKTVEITLDNWQEYFEIRPSTNGPLYNSFDEFERLDYVNWAMFLKDDVKDKVTKMEDVAIEYSFTDGYFSWFEYNLDTGEFVKKDPAAEGEMDSWLTVNDSNRDLPLSLDSVKGNGCFLVFISRHLSDSLNGNIYTFIGEAYGSMEITRIKGTIVLSE